MKPAETPREQEAPANGKPVRKVFLGRNETSFWLWEEATKADGSTELQILLPRTPIGQVGAVQREALGKTLATTAVPSLLASPRQGATPAEDHRHPVPSSLSPADTHAGPASP